MVKQLDESLQPIDHIGVQLWQAAHAWKRSFAEEMARRGYPWHLEARGHLLAHLGPSGRSQVQLAQAMGVTKQAVQQLADKLEADGVVTRVADPSDKRAKRIQLTPLGHKDFAERNKVKRLIEQQYRDKLGAELFGQLSAALARLNP